MRQTVLVLAWLLACGGAAGSAQIPRGSGEITGIVLDAVTRRPVFDATVTLSFTAKVTPGSGVVARDVIDAVPAAFRRLNFYTQADGRFRLKQPATGHYSLAARKPGYVPGYFGQQKPRDDMQFFDLAQDELMPGVTLLLWPGASIAGAVRSRSGVPLPGKWVQLFEVRDFHGVRSLQPVIERAQTTDNAGRYRFVGLMNGRYLVRASTIEPLDAALAMARLPVNSSRPRPDEADATYASGPLPSSRDFIDVGTGQARTGVDFALPDGPLKTFRVSGRIEGTAFSPAGQKVRLVLTNAGADFPAYLEIASASIADDGTFVLPHVPAGSYRIRSLMWPGFDAARHNPPGIGPPEQQLIWAQGRTAWIDHELIVRDADVSGLAIAAVNGARVTGRIALSSELQGFQMSALWIEARSLDGWNLQNLPVGWADPEGTFTSTALPPGRYTILPKANGNQWFSESAMLRGADTIASGLEVGSADVSELVVTLTSMKARVSGKVSDATTTAARSDARVLYFRKGGNWESGKVGVVGPEVGFERTSRTADYELSLNAGDYYIAAVVGDFPESWWEPAFLRSLIPRATTVSLRRGASIVEPLVAHVLR